MFPTFSIIINTLDRGPMLQKTLESFRWIRYKGEFEVIVINGPSRDNTEEVIASWLPQIRVGRCQVPNLSVSRNIGVAMAQGDLVAFIDDDAYPEPEWLAQHAAAFDSAAVGAVGGIVYDHTGCRYQYEYRTANRLLNCNWSAESSFEEFCFPGSFEFPYPPGGNASFRRSALLEVGGFDEEIEYYGDETELTCRLIDAGYVIRLIPGGYVHHKSAAGSLRNQERIIRNWYPIIKNKIYFSLKHGRKYQSLSEIFSDNLRFSSIYRHDVTSHIAAGRLHPDELVKFESENQRAWQVGVTRGLAGQAKLLTEKHRQRWKGAFSRFQPIEAPEGRVIVIVSRFFPPEQDVATPTFSGDRAEALAAQGHIVHIVTQSKDTNRVDFEHGAWVHRIVTRDVVHTPEALKRKVPQDLWNWSATALEEVKRISGHRHIDVIEAPVWDCQGIAFLLDHQWALVTSVDAGLRYRLDLDPQADPQDHDLGRTRSPSERMIELQCELISGADAVSADSEETLGGIQGTCGFQFDRSRTLIMSPRGESLGRAQLQFESLSAAPGVIHAMERLYETAIQAFEGSRHNGPRVGDACDAASRGSCRDSAANSSNLEAVARKPGPPRITIIAGKLLPHDAVSSDVVRYWEYLRGGTRWEVNVLAAGTELDHVPARVVPDVAELLLTREFLDADVLVYHFGTYHPFLDALLVGNGRAQQVVVFHFLAGVKSEQYGRRSSAERSYPLYNLRGADRVFVECNATMEMLVERGIDPAKIEIEPAPPHSAIRAPSDAQPAEDTAMPFTEFNRDVGSTVHRS